MSETEDTISLLDHLVLLLILTHFRSSRPEMFYKKGVLRNFVKFTGKHLSFFNKVADFRPQLIYFEIYKQSIN